MRVIEYTAHNIGRVSDIKFNLDGSHLWIVGGKNGQGKTSSIRALQIALCGRSGMEKGEYPEPALKEGEDEGWVRVKLSGDESVGDLDHIIVELHLERRRDGSVKESFRILDSAGDEAGSPRKLLQDLYSTKAFDPLGFDKMDKKARREVLMKLVGLDLDGFKAEHDRIYKERTAVNAEGTKLAAKVEVLPFYADVPAEPIVVGALMDQFEEVRAKNTAILAANKAAYDADTSVDKQSMVIEDLEQEIADLQGKLEDAKKEEGRLRDVVNELAIKAEALGELQDAESIGQQIKDAAAINDKVAANKRKNEEEVELEKLRAKSKSLTKALNDLADEQDKNLKSAKWPVPGLSVDDEGVLIDGMPYEVTCTSKRIFTSASIGVAQNPTLRLMVCRDGSDLDNDTMAGLEQFLQANEFQMIVEMVTRTKADEDMCAVVIRDGAVATAAE
jgi:DNA repair exonuclease SbcCD ATPase subunit